ncbi:hypothetical protein [Corynebacterium sp.]|uniref:AMIN-like domain-containing (lipo)protein n=1 Tax=Corynebacterium sp. TaxID=1720 RepID=UPI0026DBF973|nr:hypothetical protein [Corynebacterium sp.]MDO5031656.1 hypothetical protein [Corynebacterium sp.]
MRSYLPLAAAVLLLSGCASTENSSPAPLTTAPTSDPHTESSAATTQTTPPQNTAPSSEAKPAAMLGTASMQDQPLNVGEPADLVPVDVRVGHHEGFDRVVIEFTGQGTPGFYTQYTDSPAAQGSGHPVDYPGSTALVLGVEGTPWPSTPEKEAAFITPQTFPGAGNVVGVVYTSTFEAQSQFVIGLHAKAPHAVSVLEKPTRLVVDLPN